MRTHIQAIRSKPTVGLSRAVGSIKLTADDIVDSTLLTALTKMFLHGKYPALRSALGEAAKQECDEMRKGDAFKMTPPRKAKTV